MQVSDYGNKLASVVIKFAAMVMVSSVLDRKNLLHLALESSGKIPNDVYSKVLLFSARPTEKKHFLRSTMIKHALHS